MWLALNGAEPIDPVMLERFGRHFAPAGLRPEALVPCYGLAEATLPVSFDSHERPPTVDWVNRAALNDDLLAVPGVPGASETRGVVSCGTTPPGVEVRITADGRVLSERGVGEIEIRGNAVTAGYYRESEPSGLPGGWRGTGDLGYLADGCLYVTGRSKEMLILAGQNYYPQDVEDGVRSVPGVYRRAAIAVVVPPDPAAELPERIAVLAEAVLVDDPDTAAAYTALAAGIRRAAAGALGGATVDVVLLTPNTIMRTTSGKFQRLLMRKRLLKGTLGSVVAHVSARETLPPSAAAGGAPSPR